MNTYELVEWQKIAPNGLVYPWWTHPFLDVLEQWDLSNMRWLETGGGRSTAWLRSRCKWVDTIETNIEWANQAEMDCLDANFSNGVIYAKNLREGYAEDMQQYMALIPKDCVYDIVSVDGIYRNEVLEWAIKHFQENHGGIIVIDNLDQDYVWISPAAMELIAPFPQFVYVQENHTNNEGKKWNTRYVVVNSMEQHE